jgi:hypothetical protein
MMDTIDVELDSIYICSYVLEDDGEPMGFRDCGKPGTVVEADGHVHCDEHSDTLCRLCEIGQYVRGIFCNQPAKHGWGHGSIIFVCDTHVHWNPYMLEGGLCPDCGRLGDHRVPCNWRKGTAHE